MQLMRDNRDSLLAVLEAFIHDPLLQWVLLENKRSMQAAPPIAAAAAQQQQQMAMQAQQALNQRAAAALAQQNQMQQVGLRIKHSCALQASVAFDHRRKLS